MGGGGGGGVLIQGYRNTRYFCDRCQNTKISRKSRYEIPKILIKHCIFQQRKFGASISEIGILSQLTAVMSLITN